MQELEQLQALGDAGKAAGMAAYHKAPRVYLGVAVPVIDGLAREWRAELDVAGRSAAQRVAAKPMPAETTGISKGKSHPQP